MADKAIGDLNVAPGSIDDANTLFVVQQSGAAYKVTGHEFITALGTILDGHGGVKSITYTAPVAPSLDGTMVITLADNSTTTVTVSNGKGISSIAKTGTAGLVDTYTISYNDGTSTTFSVTNGAKGDQGDAWYVWIRYAGSEPTSDADMGTTPDDWIGIYSGTEDDPSDLHYTDFDWFEYKGEKGDTGDAASIYTQNVSYQTSSSGTVAPSGSWTTTVPTVTPGDFLWTRTQIQFNTGSPITAYSVSRYGIDGSGSVVTVNGVSPDGNGNVALTATDIPTSDNTSVQSRISGIETDVGDVSQLTTTAGTVVPAINELKTSITNIDGFTNRLKGKKIAMYGDSWATSNYGYLGKAYIESVTGETVHVVGLGSQTMAGIYTNCWDSYNADIYVIEGGLNDASLHVGGTAFTAAIDNMLAAIRTVNANAEIYFITPFPVKKTNQYADLMLPLEFYRIGIWSCAPFKNYGVINALKWQDVKLRSDNVHPTQASEELIGKHIVNALLNYGDEETHCVEYSKLLRSDDYLYFEANNGVMSLVMNNSRYKASTINTYTGMITPNGELGTVFATNGVAFINPSNGAAGQFKYDSGGANTFILYCYGVASGGNIYTDVVRLPLRVLAWDSPYM